MRRIATAHEEVTGAVETIRDGSQLTAGSCADGELCARTRLPAAQVRDSTTTLFGPTRPVTPPSYGRVMVRRRFRLTPRAYEPERIVGLWWCPVCGNAAHRYARPGAAAGLLLERLPSARVPPPARGRLPVAPPPPRPPHADHTPSAAPLRRASSRERSHAVREPDALVGGRRDTSGRAITLCGAFARPARPRARGHVRFVSDVPWSCRSCTLLGGLNSVPP